MCREKHIREERCPCDTSAARLARRHNAKAIQRNSGEALTTTESRALPVESKPEVTREDIRASISHLQGLSAYGEGNTRGMTSEAYIELDKAVITVGAQLKSYAEVNFSAPTDEDFAALIASDPRHTELLKHINDEEKLNEQFDVECDKVAVAHGMKLKSRYAHFARIQELLNSGEVSEDEVAHLNDLKREAFEVNKKVRLLRESFKEEKVAGQVELWKKRNAAMKEALTAVGVEFSDPGVMNVAEDSHSAAVKAVQEAITLYPASWVALSNRAVQERGRPLRVKQTAGRAHYASARRQRKMKKNVHVSETVIKPASWTPDPYSKEESTFERVPDDGVYTDKDSKQQFGFNAKAGEGESMWVRVQHEYIRPYNVTYQEDDLSPQPKGQRWEQVRIREKFYNSSTKEWDVSPEPVLRWRRKVVVQSKDWRGMELASELTVSPEASPFSTRKGHRVAVHELAHRFEDTVPGLKAMESAFLLRRSGRWTDEPEYATSIYSHTSKEKGYKDNFPNHYMGKVYDSGDREILSMGMETMFCGTNDGFAKSYEAKDNTDADYQHFILGVLASSVKLGGDEKIE